MAPSPFCPQARETRALREAARQVPAKIAGRLAGAKKGREGWWESAKVRRLESAKVLGTYTPWTAPLPLTPSPPLAAERGTGFGGTVYPAWRPDGLTPGYLLSATSFRVVGMARAGRAGILRGRDLFHQVPAIWARWGRGGTRPDHLMGRGRNRGLGRVLFQPRNTRNFQPQRGCGQESQRDSAAQPRVAPAGGLPWVTRPPKPISTATRLRPPRTRSSVPVAQPLRG